MKVLIADDDRVSSRLLESMTRKWGYEVVVAHDGLQAWQAIQEENAPQLVILDWMMPGLDGPDICRRVRERPDSPYTYVILLTARNRQEDILIGLEAGADEYLVKPVNPQELQVRMRAGQRILDLQASLLAMQEELRVKATHDALTGLWNRGAILDILERDLKRADREEKPVAVAVGDLDNFKQINDTHGHMAGDEVLRETAGRMRSITRAYDTIGRYGGEEFLITLPGCDAAQARALAERVIGAIASAEVNISTGMIRVTMSMGVAVSAKDRPLNADELLRAADAALYRAKQAGKNRVEFIGDNQPVGPDKA